MLIIFGGLPGTGKTTLARELARRLAAVHVRIDSIEQAIRSSSLRVVSIDDAGYRVGYAVAADNLAVGHRVIADSVNPLTLTRDAWVDVARRADVDGIEVEVVCSDRDEHRRRIEARSSDIPALRLPTWDEVVGREYHAWERDRIVVDTAHQTIEQAVDALHVAIAAHGKAGG